MATAAALFQNEKEVENALKLLDQSGFDPDSITVLSKNTVEQSAPQVRPIPDAGAAGTGNPVAPGAAGGAAVVRPASVRAALTERGIPRGSADFFEDAVARGASVVAVQTGLFKRRKARRALRQANGITPRKGTKAAASEEPDRPDQKTRS